MVLTRPVLERFLASLTEQLPSIHIVGAKSERDIGGGGREIRWQRPGPPGAAGSDGENLEGPRGETGDVGEAGDAKVGPTGPVGETGPAGPDAEKTAILKLADGRNVGLCAQECQDVIFEDVITFTLPAHVAAHSVRLCAIWLATLEPGTLRLISLLPSEPVVLDARLHPQELRIRLRPQAIPLRITALLQGIRKGHADARQQSWTEDQRLANERFYQDFHAA